MEGGRSHRKPYVMSMGTGGLGLIAWVAGKKTPIKNNPNSKQGCVARGCVASG
jgi:hypothetical protein